MLCCALLALQMGSHANLQCQAGVLGIPLFALPSAQGKHLGELSELSTKQLQSPKILPPGDSAAPRCMVGNPKSIPASLLPRSRSCSSERRAKGSCSQRKTHLMSKEAIPLVFLLK